MSNEKAIIQRITHDLIGDLSINERREVVAHLTDEYGAGKLRDARRAVKMEQQQHEKALQLIKALEKETF